MSGQVCYFGVCYPVPSELVSLIPGASVTSSSTQAAATTSQAAATTAIPTSPSTTVIPATTIVSAGTTITAPASTVTAAGAGAAGATVTVFRTVTAGAAAASGSATAGGAGAGAGGLSVGPNGLPAIPSGIVIPDNFKLPPGFKLPAKPKYNFDVDARLSDAVIYALFLIPVLYLMWKHGRRGLLIWPLMFAFCIISIARDALFMWPGGSLLKIGTGWIVTTAMLLILLISFPMGLNFEAGSFLGTSRASRFLVLLVTGLFFVLGLILGTVGSVPLSLVAQIRNKPYNLKMARAGYILILIFLVFTMIHSLLLLRKTSPSRSSGYVAGDRQRKRIRALLWGAILCVPFIAVRVGRSIDYAFTYYPTRNPINGSFVTIFVFVWLMQLLTFLVIVTAGFVALRIKYGHRHSGATEGHRGAVDDDVVSSDVDIKAAEAGAVGSSGRRHRFRRRRHHDDVAGSVDPAPEGVAAGDGYYPPDKHHPVREV